MAEEDLQGAHAMLDVADRLEDGMALLQVETMELMVAPLPEFAHDRQAVVAPGMELGFSPSRPCITDALLLLVELSDLLQRRLSRRICTPSALKHPPCVCPALRMGDRWLAGGVLLVGDIAVG